MTQYHIIGEQQYMVVLSESINMASREEEGMPGDPGYTVRYGAIYRATIKDMEGNVLATDHHSREIVWAIAKAFETVLGIPKP